MKRLEIIPVLFFMLFVMLTPLTKLYEVYKVTNTYRETRGKILISEVAKIELSDDGGKYFAYKPSIQYEYEVDGNKITGGQYDLEKSHFERKFEANLIVNGFKPQDEVKVFYNPSAPLESVLTKQVSPFYYVSFIALTFWMLLLAALCIWNYKKE